mgnify:CR=1 FL=1
MKEIIFGSKFHLLSTEGIESSCDDTGASVLDLKGSLAFWIWSLPMKVVQHGLLNVQDFF